MHLSAYRKIQKVLLASFCASAALLMISIFLGGTTANTVANTNRNANAAHPTPNVSIANSNPPANTITNGFPHYPVNTNSPANSSKSPEESGYGLMILGGVSFLTSLTSLLGFISTTVLAWRKEKRETDSMRYENEKKEVELELLKRELDKMKSEEKELKPKRPRKPKKTGKDKP